MNNSQDKFTDEYFNLHVKAKILGQGGQGVVYRTTDPDVALKLVTDESGNPITDPKQISRYYRQLKKISLLPLPNNLNLAIPVSLLKGQAGYVMRLLSEMVSFSSFWLNGDSSKKITSDDVPKWLNAMPEDAAKQIVHYRNTGGLRRRLNALYKCSAILARLHGAGLVYGDISPENIFISTDIKFSEVWFIDADNMRFDTESRGHGVYTPKYGAPELVQGIEGGSPRTDCHAFATMAFYLLSMIHPFIGKKVEDEDDTDADWADDDFDDGDIEEKAYAGHLPWIDDNDDDSNSNTSGLPRTLVLTDHLMALFQRTFGEGRAVFWKRPAIYHWSQAFATAADKTILCSSCQMSFFVDYDGDTCPYCQAPKPTTCLIQSYRWSGTDNLNPPCWTYTRELIEANNLLTLPQRLFKTFSMTDSDNPVLELRFDDEKIHIKKLDNCDFALSVALNSKNEHEFKPFASQLELPISALTTGFWLYAKGDEARLIKCSLMGATNGSK